MALSRRVGRSRFTLILLILTSITLVTLDFRGFGPIDSARSAALSAFAPVGDAATSVFRPVGNFWHGAFQYDDLKRQNDDLRSQLLDLQGQVTSDQVTREQYQQLLTQLNLPFLGDLPTAKAKVVSGAIANFDDTIEIDKGTNDKIKVNMSVTAGLGLVGIVVQVSPDRSVVRLVTDSSFSVGVSSVPFNAVGVAHGQGTNHGLTAEVNAGQPVLPGNVLVTQGGPKSLYPQGIPVGTVATVTKDAALLTQNLDVDLMVNLNDLAYVSVVLWEPSGEPRDPNGLDVKVVLRVAVLLFTAAVLERGVFSQLRVHGVAADVLLLMAISAGMVGGSDDGALVGFFAGLTLDLLVQTPLGLSALAYCITGYVVGLAQGAVVRSTRWQAPALAFAASFLGVGLYVLASLVVGRSGLINRHLLAIMLVVATANAILIGLVNRPMRWALGEPTSRRSALR